MLPFSHFTKFTLPSDDFPRASQTPPRRQLDVIVRGLVGSKHPRVACEDLISIITADTSAGLIAAFQRPRARSTTASSGPDVTVVLSRSNSPRVGCQGVAQ